MVQEQRSFSATVALTSRRDGNAARERELRGAQLGRARRGKQVLSWGSAFHALRWEGNSEHSPLGPAFLGLRAH